MEAVWHIPVLCLMEFDSLAVILVLPASTLLLQHCLLNTIYSDKRKQIVFCRNRDKTRSKYLRFVLQFGLYRADFSTDATWCFELQIFARNVQHNMNGSIGNDVFSISQLVYRITLRVCDWKLNGSVQYLYWKVTVSSKNFAFQANRIEHQYTTHTHHT